MRELSQPNMLGSPQVQEKLAKGGCVRSYFFKYFQGPPLEDMLSLLPVLTAKSHPQKTKLLGKNCCLDGAEEHRGGESAAAGSGFCSMKVNEAVLLSSSWWCDLQSSAVQYMPCIICNRLSSSLGMSLFAGGVQETETLRGSLSSSLF